MFVWDEKSARQSLRDASVRFARHEAVVIRLRSEGDITASEAAALKLRDLKLHLRYLEAVLVAVVARLSHGWQANAAEGASTDNPTDHDPSSDAGRLSQAARAASAR
jgi:hypothetical protein